MIRKPNHNRVVLETKETGQSDGVRPQVKQQINEISSKVGLPDRGGNPAHGLKQAYQQLVAIQDPQELYTTACGIVKSYAGKGATEGKVMQFCNTLKQAMRKGIHDMQFYITNFILKAGGDGVVQTGRPAESVQPWAVAYRDARMAVQASITEDCCSGERFLAPWQRNFISAAAKVGIVVVPVSEDFAPNGVSELDQLDDVDNLGVTGDHEFDEFAPGDEGMGVDIGSGAGGEYKGLQDGGDEFGGGEDDIVDFELDDDDLVDGHDLPGHDMIDLETGEFGDSGVGEEQMDLSGMDPNDTIDMFPGEASMDEVPGDMDADNIDGMFGGDQMSHSEPETGHDEGADPDLINLFTDKGPEKYSGKL